MKRTLLILGWVLLLKLMVGSGKWLKEECSAHNLFNRRAQIMSVSIVSSRLATVYIPPMNQWSCSGQQATGSSLHRSLKPLWCVFISEHLSWETKWQHFFFFLFPQVRHIGFSTGWGSVGEFKIWRKEDSDENHNEAFTLGVPHNTVPGSEKATAFMIGNTDRHEGLSFGSTKLAGLILFFCFFCLCVLTNRRRDGPNPE